MSTTGLASGSCVHSISGPVAQAVCGDGDVLVYAAASVGVIQSLQTKTFVSMYVWSSQVHLNGHDDEISCISVSRDGTLIATGQMGKRAYVCIWEVGRYSTTNKYLARDSADHRPYRKLGGGFFQRGVCAAEFSFDEVYLCAIGCDDHHTMGIWDIDSGAMLAHHPTQHGLPPQIKALHWVNDLVPTAFICKTTNAETDMIVTAGERHLRFWAFRRPRNSSPAQLEFRQSRIGKITTDAPKTYYCVDSTIRTSGKKSLDLINAVVYTGASDGHVFIWVNGAAQRLVRGLNGPVRCLQILGDSLLVIAGGAAQLAVLDMSTPEHGRIFTTTLPSSTTSTSTSTSATGTLQTSYNFGMTGGASPRLSGRDTSRPSSATMRRSISAGGTRPLTASQWGRRQSNLGNTAPYQDTVAGGVTGRSSERGVRRVPTAPQMAWVTPSEESRAPPLPAGPSRTHEILGMTFVKENNDYVAIVSTSLGKTHKVLLSSDASVTPENDSIRTLFYFHYEPVWAVATGTLPLGGFIFSGGDDKWLCVWDSGSYDIVVRAKTPAPIRCIDVCERVQYVACGMLGGAIAIFCFQPGKLERSRAFQNSSTRGAFTLLKLTTRRDRSRDISDIKFSPNVRMLAVGGHDMFIDIYACKFSPPTNQEPAAGELRQLRRLRGHSSYITHIDWSADNRLLRSTCGAYEILTWDALSGSQAAAVSKANDAQKDSDVVWYTQTCPLGFTVMGIWRPDSDGTDVNSVDVDFNRRLVATGDDFGCLRIFNYPCVVKNAPSVTEGGHSSHVVAVRFLERENRAYLATGGGNDGCVMLWRLRQQTK